jgi:pre-mRNA-splicing factor SYF2
MAPRRSTRKKAAPPPASEPEPEQITETQPAAADAAPEAADETMTTEPSDAGEAAAPAEVSETVAPSSEDTETAAPSESTEAAAPSDTIEAAAPSDIIEAAAPSDSIEAAAPSGSSSHPDAPPPQEPTDQNMPDATDDTLTTEDAATTEDAPNTEDAPTDTPSTQDPAAAHKARMERFAALRARARSSATSNHRAATAEAQRVATPISQLSSLSRKRDAATAKLQRLEMEEAGEDFERRRAWDWTVEESEAWDRRVRRKEAARDNNAFADYAAEANKTYKRQVKKSIMTADARERYEREKAAAIDRAARAGGLDIVELDDGELIAVDRDGSFYSTADSTAAYGSAGVASSKPDKAAVDRLVEDLRRAEEVRLRKRRERIAQQEDAAGDVTFINEKNKQFNMKLARFYDKFTADVRDSFERGTMI